MSLADEDKQWIAAQLERVEQRMRERIEHIETSLLTEFHKCRLEATEAARLEATDSWLRH